MSTIHAHILLIVASKGPVQATTQNHILYSIQVLLKRKKSARVYQLRSLKKLGKSVGRANRSAIARQVMKDDRIRSRVTELLGINMGKEMKKLHQESNVCAAYG